MKPSWEDAPAWALRLAMDADGEWTWFRRRPSPHDDLHIWTVPDWYAEHAGFSDPDDEGWRETLEERPNETP